MITDNYESILELISMYSIDTKKRHTRIFDNSIIIMRNETNPGIFKYTQKHKPTLSKRLSKIFK